MTCLRSRRTLNAGRDAHLPEGCASCVLQLNYRNDLGAATSGITAATAGNKYAAANMWRRSSFTPSDVDTAQVYDGFTIITMQWLESLGFCAPGEGGPYVAEGNTRLGGKLPTNTNGGMLNMGRVHGISHVIEGVLQLRGACGPRQTPNARVAVVANGGGPNAGCMILHRP